MVRGVGFEPTEDLFPLESFGPFVVLPPLRYYDRSAKYKNATVIVTDMREFIFTPHERAMISHFLETGNQGPGFRTLKFRIKKNVVKLRDDMVLIEKLLKKVRF